MYHETIRQREVWVDFIRIAAAFMVVWGHSTSCGPWIYTDVSSLNWHLANIAGSVTRMCVPLFFMISGHLLLGRKIILGEFFAKRVVKIVIPFLTWSVLYLLWHKYYSGSQISLLGAIRSLINGSASYHLWFFYAIIGLYLFVPIISWLLDSDTRKRANYFIVFWLIAASLIPFSDMVLNDVTGCEVKTALDLTMFGGYSGYMVIGYLVGRISMTRTAKWTAVIFVVIGILGTIVGTSILSSKSGGLVEYFYGNTTPNILVASVGGFLLLRQLGHLVGNSGIAAPVLSKLSSISLGVYLVHPVILDLIRSGYFTGSLAALYRTTPFSIPIVALVAFTFSCGISYVIMQLPVVRRII